MINLPTGERAALAKLTRRYLRRLELEAQRLPEHDIEKPWASGSLVYIELSYGEQDGDRTLRVDVCERLENKGMARIVGRHRARNRIMLTQLGLGYGMALLAEQARLPPADIIDKIRTEASVWIAEQDNFIPTTIQSAVESGLELAVTMLRLCAAAGNDDAAERLDQLGFDQPPKRPTAAEAAEDLDPMPMEKTKAEKESNTPSADDQVGRRPMAKAHLTAAAYVEILEQRCSELAERCESLEHEFAERCDNLGRLCEHLEQRAERAEADLVDERIKLALAEQDARAARCPAGRRAGNPGRSTAACPRAPGAARRQAHAGCGRAAGAVGGRAMKTRAWKNAIFNLGIAAQERIDEPEVYRHGPLDDGMPTVEVRADCLLDILADLDALECFKNTGEWPEGYEL